MLPLMAMRELLAASKVSTTAPAALRSVIRPVPRWIASLNSSTTLPATATPSASSAGVKRVTSGAVTSAVDVERPART